MRSPKLATRREKTPYLVPCVKLLCGNHGVMVDEFISLYIGEEGISEIIEPVFEVTDPVFRELLALGQSERAEAAKTILQPLDVFSSDMMAYMRVLNVPAGAEVWQGFRRTFPKDTVDESTDHVMRYNGSGRTGWKRMLSRTEQQRSMKSEVYRNGHSTLFCAAA